MEKGFHVERSVEFQEEGTNRTEGTNEACRALGGAGRSRVSRSLAVIVHLGTEALNLFKDLPGEGPLFP